MARLKAVATSFREEQDRPLLETLAGLSPHCDPGDPGTSTRWLMLPASTRDEKVVGSTSGGVDSRPSRSHPSAAWSSSGPPVRVITLNYGEVQPICSNGWSNDRADKGRCLVVLGLVLGRTPTPCRWWRQTGTPATTKATSALARRTRSGEVISVVLPRRRSSAASGPPSGRRSARGEPGNQYMKTSNPQEIEGAVVWR